MCRARRARRLQASLSRRLLSVTIQPASTATKHPPGLRHGTQIPTRCEDRAAPASRFSEMAGRSSLDPWSRCATIPFRFRHGTRFPRWRPDKSNIVHIGTDQPETGSAKVAGSGDPTTECLNRGFEGLRNFSPLAPLVNRYLPLRRVPIRTSGHFGAVVDWRALPTWPYSSGWGYYHSSGLGLVRALKLQADYSNHAGHNV